MTIVFRASSVGKLMTEPKSIDAHLVTEEVAAIQAKTSAKRSDGEKQLLEHLKLLSLSAGAKTYIRDLAKEAIFGADLAPSSKYMDKGNAVEDESIALLNRVRGFNLVKNTERRTVGLLTGECDLTNPAHGRGHDLKSAWDLSTFPAFPEDAQDALYEWQMRAYMKLWDYDLWEVNHALVSTPADILEKLRFENLSWHIVDHIPEYQRLTTWTVTRDRALEAAMDIKLSAAKAYYQQVIHEFDRLHQPLKLAA